MDGKLGPESTAPDVAAWFARASAELTRSKDEQLTLERILKHVLDVVPGHWCGITLRRRRGRLETVAASDEVVRRCDELQHQLGEGPLLGAAIEEVGFLCHDTAHDSRWTRWGPAVAELGVRSVVSLQLVSHLPDGGPRLLGGITLYDSRRNAFTKDDLDWGLVYATHAAGALSTVRELEGLESAISSRHTIGLAQGILMERYDLSEAAAFEALQRYSSENNVKLRELARRIVAEQKGCSQTSGTAPLKVPAQTDLRVRRAATSAQG